MDVKERIIQGLTNNSQTLERVLIIMDDLDIWVGKHYKLQGDAYKRVKYLAGWVRQGKRLTGKFIEEARRFVLDHVSLVMDRLIQTSIEKTQIRIKEQEEKIKIAIQEGEAKIQELREWQAACEVELNKPLCEGGSKVELPEKPIWKTCAEEGLF